MIDHVEEVVGSLPYKTLKGNKLSPVFYEAVQEYHDALAVGNLDKLLSFVVSKNAALKVADNVYQLAVKLNNGAVPDSLDVLPLDLHDSFTEEQRDFILMRELPAVGSKRRAVYDDTLDYFRERVTDLVARAYRLPSAADERNEVTVARLFEFTGLTAQQVGKRILMLGLVKRAVAIVSTLAIILGAVSIFFLLQFWFGVVMVAGFGSVSFIIIAIAIFEGDEVCLNSKNRVSGALGLFKKQFSSMDEKYGKFVKPYLASMESYLLQEK